MKAGILVDHGLCSEVLDGCLDGCPMFAPARPGHYMG